MKVAIQHPIVSFDLNICELVKKRTITTSRVDRLGDTCIDLGLDISDISPQKRKKPFIADSHNQSRSVPALPSNWVLNVLRVTDPLIIKAVRVLFTRRRCVTAESYISDFSHSSSPLLVKPSYLCVGRFSVYSKLASAEGAEGMQMLESMFTGWEVNVN